jgi:ribosomal protein L29
MATADIKTVRDMEDARLKEVLVKVSIVQFYLRFRQATGQRE